MPIPVETRPHQPDMATIFTVIRMYIVFICTIPGFAGPTSYSQCQLSRSDPANSFSMGHLQGLTHSYVTISPHG